MSDTITIWHNPRCSKSRETLKRIEAAGHAPVVRLYLADAPDAEEIAAVQALLGVPLVQMMRVKEAAFRDAGLSKDSPEADLLAAMAANPVLIERPVVIRGGRAVIGRPPEAVDALL